MGKIVTYISVVYNRVMHNILKDGKDCGLDPSFIKFLMKSSLACRVSEPILKIG